jgi:hypothetical protein
MAVVTTSERQWPLTAEASFDFDDYTSGVAFAVVDVPAGAIVVGGYVMVTTAWDSATSSTLQVGDGGSASRYDPSDVDMKAATGKQIVPSGYVYPTKDTIDIEITDVGAPSAGVAKVVIEYIIEGRGNEVQL